MFPGSLGFDAAIALQSEARPPRERRDGMIGRDVALKIYTSGTTGLPKGAVGTNRNHVHNIMNSLLGGAIAQVMNPPAASPEPSAAPAPGPVALWTFPFFHIGGLSGLYVMTVAGGTIVTQFKWDPVEALELIQREKVNVVAGVPTVVRSLLEHPDASAYDLSSLASIAQGGSPVPPDLIGKIEDGFAKSVSPGNGYGLTETTSAVVSNSGEAYFARKDSVGLPVPTSDVRIVDEFGNDVPKGDIGEVWITGPNVVRGYWNKPEETAESFTDGWFHTGDAGRVDDDGFVYVVDRIKDVVIRGGENVYCAEVEAALYEHPAVQDVAVVGVPDVQLGEEVAAVVRVRDGATVTAAELQAHVAARLARFKVPSIVELLTDTDLPRNATGKLLKRDIRTELAGRLGR
jgi:acyl-CoA synthetase (AMP-forming)/AMP-acid ligase II